MGWTTSLTRLCVAVGLLLSLALPASAREGWRDWCWIGNQHVVTSGLTSSTTVQASFPQCTVTVLVHGGGLATIFADNNGTPLANPFVAQTNGQFIWYANDGRYDETITSAGLPQPVTMSDILLCDPFVAGAVCAGGGGVGGAHNLLSLTHLDTIPFSPPVRGDVITSQNVISPGGTNPSWARLALGTNGQVLQSNGIDVVWATLSGAGLCSASAAGAWDVNPQTCAGEKTIQGKAGNPTVTNFNIVPASDQTGQNFYSGIAASNFFSSGSQPQLISSFNAIAGRNIATLGAPGPWSYTLGIVHEETGGTALSAALEAAMVITGGSSNGPHGINGDCFAEGTASTTNSCDGVVGEATADFGLTGTIQSLVGVLGGAFRFAGTVSVVADFAAETPTCGGVAACYAFLFPDQGTILADIDKSGNALFQTVNIGGQINQVVTKQFAGTCAMSSGTSCTFNVSGVWNTTPICLTNAQAATAIAGSCALAGVTVTVTAASSNSQTWGAVLIGNPN